MMLGLIGGTIDQAKRLVDLHRSTGARAGHAPEILSLGINRRYLWPKTTADEGGILIEPAWIKGPRMRSADAGIAAKVTA